jgi:ELWxxDGT repeat protein
MTLPITGPYLVADINQQGQQPGQANPFSNSSPDNFIDVAGTIYFRADNGANGRELWKIDPITGNAVQLEIRTGGNGSSINDLTIFNNTLYFTATDNSGVDRLWKIGANGNPEMVAQNLFVAEGDASNLVTLNGSLYFNAPRSGGGHLSYKIDSNDTVTTLPFLPLQSDPALNFGGSFDSVAVVGTTIFFGASANNNRTLWKLNDSGTGLESVKSFNSAVPPEQLTNVNGTAYFIQNTIINGVAYPNRDLWKSDGTTSGTVEIGLTGSDPNNLLNPTISNLIDVGGTLYFTTGNNYARSIWRINSTGNPEMVKNLNTNSTLHLTNINGTLYFGANTGVNGTEQLWKVSGANGAPTLINTYAPSNDAQIASAINVNGDLYFTAEYTSHHLTLWKVDGATGIATLLSDVSEDTYLGSNITRPGGQLAYSNGKLYFSANSYGQGQELWAYDISAIPGGGGDTFYSAINHILKSPFKNLVLTGTDNINGTGTALDNTITGNSGNNIINGGAGADRMIGGTGNDIYYVDNIGDVVTETSTTITEIDTVSTSISYTLTNNVENLYLTGTSNINGTGNSLNNTIVGNSGNNTLTGGDGNDTIFGGAGNDILLGGAGNDYLIAGAGNDTLTGGEGNDTLRGDAGDDNIDGGTGTNTLFEIGDVNFTATDGTLTGLGTDTFTNIQTVQLVGGSSDNTINASNLTIRAVISGRDGNDIITGGTANDVFYGENGDDTLTGGDGIDTLIGGEGNDNLNGGVGNDYLIGGAGNDNLNGGEGNDTLRGDAGDDTIDGGVGTNTLLEIGDVNFTATDSTLTGLGTDTFTNIQTVQLVGGSSDNTINATTLTTRAFLFGRDGNDNLTGGTANDVLYGENGDDTLNGGDGIDTLIGGDGNDTLLGGEGNDYLNGGAGNDNLNGENGNDTLVSGAGDDNINGGAGINTFLEIGDVNFTATDGTLTGLGTDTFTNIQTVQLLGGSSDNTINAATLTTRALLYGRDGNDILTGGTANDVLYGENGDDTLTGGDGYDILIGGEGNDTFLGGAGNDYLNGGAGNDILTGENGNDTLIGGDGNDIYVIDADVHTGTDTINETTTGGVDTLDFRTSSIAVNVNLSLTTTQTVTVAANVKLVIPVISLENVYGGTGNDTLSGNSLNNTFVGGAGDDSFSFKGALSGATTITSLFGIDTIDDFTTGQDKIVLSKATFSKITSAAGVSIGANFETVADDDAAKLSDAAIVYSQSSRSLFYNENLGATGFGSPGGSFATLTGVASLAAGDFTIV